MLIVLKTVHKLLRPGRGESDNYDCENCDLGHVLVVAIYGTRERRICTDMLLTISVCLLIAVYGKTN